MKTLGLFGGSFKPFHTGHFAKLAMSLYENDETILFYTISKRNTNGVFITKEMSYDIYNIIAPALINKALAPISRAPISARLATCKECWKVPGASSDNLLSNGLLVSVNSNNETSDTKENIFSKRKTIG